MLFVGPCRQYAAQANGALLAMGMLPAIVASPAPRHAALPLHEALRVVRLAHAHYHGLHTPVKTGGVAADPAGAGAIDGGGGGGDSTGRGGSGGGGGGGANQEDVARVASSSRVVVHAALDQGEVLCAEGSTRTDASHMVVIDGLCLEDERSQILDWLTSEQHNHNGPPPDDKWERACVDRDGDTATWGLRPELLAALVDDPPAAVVAVQSRLAALYPEFDVCYMPAEALMEEGEEDEQPLTSFVANAVMHGDPCAWHADADPSSPDTASPGSPWVAHHGYYVNRDPSRPLFVSALLYLNADWQPEWFGETMFADPESGSGLVVQPRPGRLVLMEQDMPHRISSPSAMAPGPRYSLVWKLLFVPKPTAPRDLTVARGPGAGVGGSSTSGSSILRPEWGPPLRLGSASVSCGVPAFGSAVGKR